MISTAGGAAVQNFEYTEVSVEFAATASGTLVTVLHRRLATLPPDHPARHGLQPSEFVRMMGMWRGDQLTALRCACIA